MILDLISDASEDVLVGQTLKRPFMLNHSIEEQSHIGKEELSYDLKFDSENDRFQSFVRQDIVDQSIFSLFHLYEEFNVLHVFHLDEFLKHVTISFC